MDKQLLGRLNTTVTHIPASSLSSYGDPIAGMSVDRQCYLLNKTTYAHALDGTRMVAQLTLFFGELLTVTANDKMVVNGKTWPVIMFEKYPGIEPMTGTTVVYV